MVRRIEGTRNLAWDARESEPSNIHGDQPAPMNQSYENVPYGSQESPSHYSAELETIRRLLLQNEEQQRIIQHNQEQHEKNIRELLLQNEKQQCTMQCKLKQLEKTIQDLLLQNEEQRHEIQHVIEQHEKDAEEKEELIERQNIQLAENQRVLDAVKRELQDSQAERAKDKQEHNKERKLFEEKLAAVESRLQLMSEEYQNELASKKNYIIRLKNRGFFRRLFNMDPE